MENNQNEEQYCDRCGSVLGVRAWRGCAACVNMSDEALALVFKHFPARLARVKEAAANKKYILYIDGDRCDWYPAGGTRDKGARFLFMQDAIEDAERWLDAKRWFEEKIQKESEQND